jgi:hypothetical protein
VDAVTGRILCVQTSNEDLLLSKWDRLVRIDTPDGPVWLEKGLNFDMIQHLKGTPYSKLLADLICEMIVEGKTLIRACRELNLKYADVVRWKRDHEEFQTALKDAKKDRADALHDEVLDAARESKPETKIAALQWAAEAANPEDFSSKKKPGSITVGAVQIVLATGITRPGDAGYQPPLEQPRDVGPLLPPVPQDKEEEIEEYTGVSHE